MPFTDCTFYKSRSFWVIQVLYIISTALEKGPDRNASTVKTDTLQLEIRSFMNGQPVCVLKYVGPLKICAFFKIHNVYLYIKYSNLMTIVMPNAFSVAS